MIIKSLTTTFLHFGISLFLLFFSASLSAQAVSSKTNYSNYPYWVKMMKHTNTNYYEAVKAFNTYWAGRQKPEDEGEKFAKVANENSTDEEDKTKNVPYSIEYKKFKIWQRDVKPYVQDDGSILYPSQRLQLLKASRNTTSLNSAK